MHDTYPESSLVDLVRITLDAPSLSEAELYRIFARSSLVKSPTDFVCAEAATQNESPIYRGNLGIVFGPFSITSSLTVTSSHQYGCYRVLAMLVDSLNRRDPKSNANLLLLNFEFTSWRTLSSGHTTYYALTRPSK